MVVDEVSEILSFDQTNWLKLYIAFNTKKRQEAKKAGNTFLSDFFKLKHNAAYGKTMENVRKYQDIKLMRMNNEQDEKAFLNKVHKPSFKYGRQLGDTLVKAQDRKSTRLNSSHVEISYAVFCLNKNGEAQVLSMTSGIPLSSAILSSSSTSAMSSLVLPSVFFFLNLAPPPKSSPFSSRSSS